MDSDNKTRRIYQSHRDNQRERILEAATMLFNRDGIDNVSIGRIAETARISRVTLYQYFPNKQEIAWAIFQKVAEDLHADTAVRMQQQEGNGYQRVEYLMLQWINMLETHPQHLRFIVEFNTLYAREGNPARVRHIVEQVWAQGYGSLAQMIRQGITDGSIRPDLNPDLLSAAMLNLFNGMNSRFALLGDLIRDEYGQPVMDICHVICRAFLRGIQTNPSSQEHINE
jgi:AcrR family transcriptional regulator